jgi:hypothetical protein
MNTHANHTAINCDKKNAPYLTSSEGLMMALNNSLFTLFFIKGNNSSSQA